MLALAKLACLFARSHGSKCTQSMMISHPFSHSIRPCTDRLDTDWQLTPSLLSFSFGMHFAHSVDPDHRRPEERARGAQCKRQAAPKGVSERKGAAARKKHTFKSTARHSHYPVTTPTPRRRRGGCRPRNPGMAQPFPTGFSFLPQTVQIGRSSMLSRSSRKHGLFLLTSAASAAASCSAVAATSLSPSLSRSARVSRRRSGGRACAHSTGTYPPPTPPL